MAMIVGKHRDTSVDQRRLHAIGLGAVTANPAQGWRGPDPGTVQVM